MQDKLLDMLLQENEITWQTIIYDLVKTEKMDPWDIDISILTKRYIETIKKLQEHNFFISGKVLLASAILLKIKSNKLLTEYIAQFDNQLFAKEEDLLEEVVEMEQEDIPRLLIKTPQGRKRKVTINDLMVALKKALDVDKRREFKKLQEIPIRRAEIPTKRFDIGQLIKTIYQKILGFFKKQEVVTFSQLIPSEKKEDKVMTFIPLLHLDKDSKINLTQQEHFGEIYINKAENQDAE